MHLLVLRKETTHEAVPWETASSPCVSHDGEKWFSRCPWREPCWHSLAHWVHRSCAHASLPKPASPWTGKGLSSGLELATPCAATSLHSLSVTREPGASCCHGVWNCMKTPDAVRGRPGLSVWAGQPQGNQGCIEEMCQDSPLSDFTQHWYQLRSDLENAVTWGGLGPGTQRKGSWCRPSEHARGIAESYVTVGSMRCLFSLGVSWAPWDTIHSCANYHLTVLTWMHPS